jgi:hypothetical protein
MTYLPIFQIGRLWWPVQCLNPIENLWAILKARRFKRFGIPLTRIELIEQIFSIWEEIDHFCKIFMMISFSICLQNINVQMML